MSTKRKEELLQEQLLTTAEVAQYLRVNKKTVLREIEAGKLAAFRVGHSLRITIDALIEYIKRQSVKPGEALKEEEDDDSRNQPQLCVHCTPSSSTSTSETL